MPCPTISSTCLPSGAPTSPPRCPAIPLAFLAAHFYVTSWNSKPCNGFVHDTFTGQTIMIRLDPPKRSPGLSFRVAGSSLDVLPRRTMLSAPQKSGLCLMQRMNWIRRKPANSHPPRCRASPPSFLSAISQISRHVGSSRIRSGTPSFIFGIALTSFFRLLFWPYASERCVM